MTPTKTPTKKKKPPVPDTPVPDTASAAIRASLDSQKPRICRMVVFHDGESGDMPAVINEITAEGAVHVCAFDPVFGPRNFATSGQGTEAGQWSWPVRD